MLNINDLETLILSTFTKEERMILLIGTLLVIFDGNTEDIIEFLNAKKLDFLETYKHNSN